MFGVFRKLCRNILKLNQFAILKEAIDDPYIQEQIIKLNQSQLYDKGIEADGTPTGDYSEISITKYGKEPGHIKLYDTGQTYESMKVENGFTGFVITADMNIHGVDLNVIYPHALGLTGESLSIIIPVIRTKMIEIVYGKMMQGL